MWTRKTGSRPFAVKKHYTMLRGCLSCRAVTQMATGHLLEANKCSHLPL